MNNSKPAPKRRFRFQFSLLTFLLLVTAIGSGMGIWMGYVQPVRNQWAAVKPLLERGARVETSPSEIPDWMKSVLPVGQTDNIEALFFKNTNARKSDDLKCLARLPHLKRLYLECSGLDDAGVAWIADCPTIERLAVWANPNVTNRSAAVLASLPNLKLLDVHRTSMDWHAMIELQNNPQLKVIHSFTFQHIYNSEIETMAKIDNTLKWLCIKDANETSISRATKLFPKLKLIQVDRIESVNLSTVKIIASQPSLKTVSLRLPKTRTRPEATWWRGINSHLDATELGSSWGRFRLKYRPRNNNGFPVLEIRGVSYDDLTVLKKLAGCRQSNNATFTALQIPR